MVGAHPSVFFRNLAVSGHLDPVATILPDGGTDSSIGIKEVGGLMMAQHAPRCPPGELDEKLRVLVFYALREFCSTS